MSDTYVFSNVTYSIIMAIVVGFIKFNTDRMQLSNFIIFPITKFPTGIRMYCFPNILEVIIYKHTNKPHLSRLFGNTASAHIGVYFAQIKIRTLPSW